MRIAARPDRLVALLSWRGDVAALADIEAAELTQRLDGVDRVDRPAVFQLKCAQRLRKAGDVVDVAQRAGEHDLDDRKARKITDARERLQLRRALDGQALERPASADASHPLRPVDLRAQAPAADTGRRATPRR